MKRKAFDIIVFAGNILIAFFLEDMFPESAVNHPVFPYLLILSTILYSAAACLKRRPLQLRLEKKGGEEMSGWGYLGFTVLFTMHYGLFTACLAWAMEGLSGISTSVSSWIVPIGGFIPTALTLWALIPLTDREDRTVPSPLQEIIADAFILFSLMVIYAFWEGVFVEALAGKGQESILLTLLLASLTTVPFAMFYLAPAVLFLREDYREPSTWLNALVVMLPLSVRMFLPA